MVLLTVCTAVSIVHSGSVSIVADGSGPVLVESPGRSTFSQLGWDSDVTISGSDVASVRFLLPDDAVQGEPIWYGVHLKFEWVGNPGRLGDYAFLRGDWNERSFYQFKMKRLGEHDDGFKWSTVDVVNGGSHGYELSEAFRSSSTNIAQFRANRVGLNEVSIALGLGGASNKDVQVSALKESEVVATSWHPTFFEGGASVDFDDELINLRIEGENLGWKAHDLRVIVRLEGV